MMNNSILTFLAALLSGCVTVNEQLLPKTSTPPPTTKGVVELKPGELVQQLNGEGQNRGILSGTSVLDAINTAFMTRWQDNGLISGYGKPGELPVKPTYTLTLSGTRNEDASILGAVFTGLTLYLIPSSSTLTYDMNADFTNHLSNKTYNVKFKNAVTTWQQLLLVPALPFAWLGSHHMMQDSADYLYSELKKQGAFDAPKEPVPSLTERPI